jgi:two-component system cell cycle sensor histidine kinase/response regulator CckA
MTSTTCLVASLQRRNWPRPTGRGLGSQRRIQRIEAAAIRGAEIVRELLIYAGQEQQRPAEAVDVSPLVREMLELLKVSISKHAVLKTDLRDNLPAVWGNASQIRQVVMNLVINASEAIGDKEGVITVTTTQVRGQRLGSKQRD